ncbi:hypothetical protein PGT21_020477 [Puccinia graminis f. sp. tritici]|uniref:Uncharacterized protein n=1 Tax=Puccinia graminis f. sp. tritici TaxID=56615 RepID=A0A5B0QIU7_PUCGR|nr:hypothetical protein PGT21_020477 [Puccinia graminis f. sp. tritici]
MPSATFELEVPFHPVSPLPPAQRPPGEAGGHRYRAASAVTLSQLYSCIPDRFRHPVT